MYSHSIWNLSVAILADAGCGAIVGLPSDEWGLLDAAADSGLMKAIAVRDQRIGACLATGFATVTGKPVVLALSSGPSFANALCGLLEAASLSSPVVVLTNRIPVASIGRGGFQEVDQASMAGSLIKWYFRVESMGQLMWAIRRAVHMSLNGRPGISLVEITDELVCDLGENPPALGPVHRLRALPPEEELGRAADVLASARRPLLVLGGGAKVARAGKAAEKLSRIWQAAIFTTASGRGTIDEEHPLACGLSGLYVTPPANVLLDEADVILAVGTQLEETARIGWERLQASILVQIDISPETFGQGADPQVALLGDAALTLNALIPRIEFHTKGICTEPAWKEKISYIKRSMRESYAHVSFDTSPVRATLRTLNQVFGRDTIFVQENGLHDTWGYHYPVLSVSDHGEVITPGEQTMMGFGLPAALGAALGAPGKRVVAICGDGAIGMSLAALPTICELACNLTLVVFDNSGFGWPRFCRRRQNEAETLTRFKAIMPIEEIIRSLGGWVTSPTDDDTLRVAVNEAYRVSAEGQLALILIRVQNEDDVPIGIQRTFAEQV